MIQAQAAIHATSTPSLPLRVGAQVEIHSLQSSHELNGVRGEIVRPLDLGTGRWGVLAATGRDLALKPVNLRLIPFDREGNATRTSRFPETLRYVREYQLPSSIMGQAYMQGGSLGVAGLKRPAAI